MRPVLVTAGATRNPLDAIRYISAASSGRTGVWLAAELAPAVPVHLLASPEARLRAPAGLDVEDYGSTRDLMARMETWTDAHPRGIIVHACAVGDYEADPSESKLPSGQGELVLRLRPTPKIVDRVKAWSPRAHLVSFKAASPETTEEGLEAIARAQLQRTQSDLVFANVIGRLGELVLLVDERRTRRFDQRERALQALADHLLAIALT